MTLTTTTNLLKQPLLKIRVPSGGEQMTCHEEVARKLHRSIMDANWADTNRLVLDEPFWRDVYSDLKLEAKKDGEFGKSATWTQLEELMSLMYRCESLRDYINQILELLARDAHCTPATEPNVIMEDTLLELVENWREICRKCSSNDSQKLLSSKVDESVGKGIRLLRQRYRFDWPDEHKAYY